MMSLRRSFFLSTLQIIIVSLVLFFLWQRKDAVSPVEDAPLVQRNQIYSRSLLHQPSSNNSCLTTEFNCSSPNPDCHMPSGFDFNDMYTVLGHYWNTCGADGALLFRPPGNSAIITGENATFSNKVCEAMAGPNWTRYAIDMIWNRVVQWKFPLFQLIALAPMAPLGFWVGVFAVFHLLGNPFSSIAGLVYKMDRCQSLLDSWSHKLNNEFQEAVRGLSEVDLQRLVKSITLITVSFDEFGLGYAVERWFNRVLTQLCSVSVSLRRRRQFFRLCNNTGANLAADRSTKSLPVVIAQILFVSGIIIAIIRTKSAAVGANAQTYIDVEMYSIAFTAQFLWVIPYVTLSSIVGTSQTATAIQRHLRDFRDAIGRDSPGSDVDLPSIYPSDERNHRRIYSYQPTEDFRSLFRNASSHVKQRLLRSNPTTTLQRTPSAHEVRFHRVWPWVGTIIPLITVSFATFTGLLLTWLVPPIGWSCRSNAELAIFMTWMVNHLLSFIPHLNGYRVTFLRDFSATAMTLGLVLAVQVGVFNRCSCYTLNGQVGLQLPQIPQISQLLQHRLNLHYPAITTMGILVQLLVIPGIIGLRYCDAFRVFLQRDDGKSNLDWLHRITSWMRGERRRHTSLEMDYCEDGNSLTEREDGPAISDGDEARLPCSPEGAKTAEAEHNGVSVHVKEVEPPFSPPVVISMPSNVFYPSPPSDSSK